MTTTLLANDATADNAAAIAAHIASGEPLPAADLYIRSTIQWPKRSGGKLIGAGGYTAFLQSSNVGVTRIIWAGEPGLPMIEGPISGGRIQELVLQGAIKGGTPRAGCGIRLLNGPAPTGFMVLDQVTYANLDIGFQVADEPTKLYGNCVTHRECMWHGVATCYHVMPGCGQSTRHVLYAPVFKSGHQTIFRFDAGGPLVCYAPYIGDGDDCTLLYLGKPAASGINSGNGLYTITAAQVDGSATRLRLVDHGKFAGRVRIDGSYSITARRNGLAEPLVLSRDGREGDIQIDMTNGVQWGQDAN